ncbi:MAG: DUF349 domain-containing protein [Muribaculaceae bacterium]|nr:DUF349 domain-containing protein [Muribaculaceae bacterium]
MNELEKKVSDSEETVNPGTCVESDACAVNSDPALDLSAVADAQQKEEKEEKVENSVEKTVTAEDTKAEEQEAAIDAQYDDIDDNFRKIHAMTKEELRDFMRNILSEGNMEAHRDVALVKQAYYNIRNRENMEALEAFVEAGNDPTAFSAEPDEIEVELKALYAEFKERRAAFLAAEEQRLAANLEKKQEILTTMEEIAGDIDNVNTKFNEFKTLQQAFKDIKDVPPTAETDIWKQFQGVVERFYDNLKINKELRDFDFKRNLEAKRKLIEDAKQLEGVADVIAAFRSLQDLHEQWRGIGPVAKEIRDELWDEFKAASTVINKKHQEHFEQRKAAEQRNEEAKTELCNQVEAIKVEDMKNFNDWNVATERIIELQKTWKEYGYASRKANTVLYARFRKACDDFFAAKTAYFQKTREELSENLRKKTALCERAEALKAETDVRKAADEAVKLQQEWKSIGSVPRKVSDALWQRFTSACNVFFEERRRQGKEKHRVETENLEKKQAIIDELKTLPLDGERQEVMPKIKELQAKWNEIGFVPFKLKDKIFADYREICDKLYDTYNQREARQRISNWQNRVAELKGDGQKMNREKDRLNRVLESRRNELKTIENNMGFFSIKSSAGNSMLKDMENKLKRLRQDIAELEEKIKLVDSEETKG